MRKGFCIIVLIGVLLASYKTTQSTLSIEYHIPTEYGIGSIKYTIIDGR
jgi:hypothetical protein